MKDNWTCIDQQAVNPYDSACMEFVFDDEKFKNFKRDKRYTAILEHVDPQFGQYYIDILKNFNLSDLINDLQNFKQNDILGNPQLVNYEEPFGLISPSTLRYIKNTYDISKFVENKKCKKIAEIGGGYGGLCKSLSVKVDFDEYHIYDINSSCNLAKKYLSHFDIGKKVNFNWNCENQGEFDLVISNYAYSELGLDLQNAYYENVISNSKLVYMILNKGQVDREVFLHRASKDFHINVEKVLDFWPENGYLYFTTMIKRSNNNND